MSNPAVTTLCRTTVSGLPMWMDDNIGESIHLHIGDVRVDLSNKEFSNMYDDICDALNNLVGVEGFDCHYINPVYMEDMLWRNLKHLKKVKVDNVELKKLLCPFYGEYVELPRSRAVRALEGDTKDNDDNRRSHHIGQTSEERLYSLYKSIENNGYPYHGEYIVLYGDDFIIQDGQHRAACLWKLKGDVTVPVLRFYFDNYTDFEKLSNYKKTKIYYRYKTFRENVPNIKVFFRKLVRKILHKMATLRRSFYKNKYMKKYGKNNEEFVGLYNNR